MVEGRAGMWICRSLSLSPPPSPSSAAAAAEEDGGGRGGDDLEVLSGLGSFDPDPVVDGPSGGGGGMTNDGGEREVEEEEEAAKGADLPEGDDMVEWKEVVAGNGMWGEADLGDLGPLWFDIEREHKCGRLWRIEFSIKSTTTS